MAIKVEGKARKNEHKDPRPNVIHIGVCGYHGDGDFHVDKVVDIDLGYDDELLEFIMYYNSDYMKYVKGTKEDKKKLEEVVQRVFNGILDEHNSEYPKGYIESINDYIQYSIEEEFCMFFVGFSDYNHIFDRTIDLDTYDIWIMKDGNKMDVQIDAKSLIEVLEERIKTEQYFI